GGPRRVLDRSSLIAPERLAGRELEPDRLARDDVHQRPTLDAREDGLVDLGAEGRLDHREVRLVDRLGQLLAAEDQPAPSPAQRLVGGRGHDVGVGEWARMYARRD